MPMTRSTRLLIKRSTDRRKLQTKAGQIDEHGFLFR